MTGPCCGILPFLVEDVPSRHQASSRDTRENTHHVWPSIGIIVRTRNCIRVGPEARRSRGEVENQPPKSLLRLNRPFAINVKCL
jgi:hypothetical protein